MVGDGSANNLYLPHHIPQLILQGMNSECPLCAIINTREANLFATDHWTVSLSSDQRYLGRAYVTLREHKENLRELSGDEWKDYIGIVKRLENACIKGLGATLFNWSCLMNNAYQRKPYNPHVHWHFRPRYENTVAINNITFEDPEFGHHYDRNQRRSVDSATFNEIIEKIKENL